jgi:hypothetical protein
MLILPVNITFWPAERPLIEDASWRSRDHVLDIRMLARKSIRGS